MDDETNGTEARATMAENSGAGPIEHQLKFIGKPSLWLWLQKRSSPSLPPLHQHRTIQRSSFRRSQRTVAQMDTRDGSYSLSSTTQPTLHEKVAWIHSDLAAVVDVAPGYEIDSLGQLDG